MVAKKQPANTVIVLLVSLLAGVLIGGVKFAVDDFIGWSLVIVFSLIYGTVMFHMMYRLTRKYETVWEASRTIIVFGVLAVVASAATFYLLDYKYTEYIGLSSLAEEGIDVSDRYLSFEGYLDIRGSSVSTLGRLFRGFQISGIGIYIFDLVEFLAIAFACIRGIRTITKSNPIEPIGTPVAI